MAERKKDIRTNNDLQNIAHKTKDRLIWTSLKAGGEPMCPRRVSCSWSTSDTCRVTVINEADDKSWMSKWLDFDYDKRNISVVITEHICGNSASVNHFILDQYRTLLTSWNVFLHTYHIKHTPRHLASAR
jgi:hypothetical protein